MGARSTPSSQAIKYGIYAPTPSESAPRRRRSLRRGGSSLEGLGFSALAIGIGAMQLMLDRGQDQDWFTSREIIIEAVFAGLGFYVFLVQVAYARQPLIRPALFKDINFASGVLLMFMVGTFMVSSLALMTPSLRVLSHNRWKPPG
jgi:DHA2 family multidrug resistance protein